MTVSASGEKGAYRYLDSPDGEDIDKKFLFLAKPVLATAIGLSTIDVLTYSHPKGYAQTLTRYAYISAPVIGVASTFVIASNALAGIRKKDDPWNWFVGGFAAGSVIGVWGRSTRVGFGMAFTFGLAAAGRKFAEQVGFEIFPDIVINEGGARSSSFDWTLTKERPRNWRGPGGVEV